jgi:E3 ubiquitin-protein ligase TRIP12
MHKNYQPSNPCGNKFLQKRWDDVNYADHKTRVRIAKPMVDTKAPKERLHVRNKLKKQQLERERRAVIDRDNYTLLSSMQRTMEGGRCTVDHKYTYEHHSLNYEQRRRELSKINNDNHGILSRLQTVKPHYRVHDWLSDWQRHQTKVQMITAFPHMMHTYPGQGGTSRARTVPSKQKPKNQLTDSRQSLPSSSQLGTDSSLSLNPKEPATEEEGSETVDPGHDTTKSNNGDEVETPEHKIEE